MMPHRYTCTQPHTHASHSVPVTTIIQVAVCISIAHIQVHITILAKSWQIYGNRCIYKIDAVTWQNRTNTCLYYKYTISPDITHFALKRMAEKWLQLVYTSFEPFDSVRHAVRCQSSLFFRQWVVKSLYAVLVFVCNNIMLKQSSARQTERYFMHTTTVTA